MSVTVAIPIQFATIKVHVEKGRHWSVVEHVILHAICSRPRSAAELAKAGNIPIRLVIEALIELMRAGWAEIRPEQDRMVFAATAGGEQNVKLETLPPVTRPLSRSTKFAVEQVTGGVLRWRELNFVPDRSPRLDLPDTIKLPATHDLPPKSQREIIATLLDDDESFRGADASAARPGQGYALVSFVGNRPVGLPRNVPQKLKDLVRDAARSSGATPGSLAIRHAPELSQGSDFELPKIPISFSTSDLIAGGQAHLELRDELIERARSLLILHSTFFGPDAIEKVFPSLIKAARERGVVTHLFYGKDDRTSDMGQTGRAVARAQELIRAEKIGSFIHLHPFSTRSHAKLIVADDGTGGYKAVVGSCNWLSTTFNLFEASVVLTDPHSVSAIVNALAEMAYQATGRDAGIALELAGLAVNLERAAPAKGRAVAQIVLGPEHARILEIARDDADRRIVIGSHRVGASAETLSLVPTRAAVRDNDVEATAYYGELPESPGSATLNMIAGDPEEGRIRFVQFRKMHAKFLVWDNDDLLVTSQNLLSADPMSKWGEIGIHIKSAGLAKRLMDLVEEHRGE